MTKQVSDEAYAAILAILRKTVVNCSCGIPPEGWATEEEKYFPLWVADYCAWCSPAREAMKALGEPIVPHAE